VGASRPFRMVLALLAGRLSWCTIDIRIIRSSSQPWARAGGGRPLRPAGDGRRDTRHSTWESVCASNGFDGRAVAPQFNQEVVEFALERLIVRSACQAVSETSQGFGDLEPSRYADVCQAPRSSRIQGLTGTSCSQSVGEVYVLDLVRKR